MIKTRISKNISCATCYVNHLCLGRDLDVTALQILDPIIKNIRQVAKKEYIYLLNDPMLHLYALNKGSCKEYWIDEAGNECITNFYFPGDIIGMESISRKKYMFYTAALEKMELCVIPVKELLDAMCNSPDILKRFLTINTQKMQHDQSNRTGITANEKVSDFILNIAIRLQERNPHQKQMTLTMSQVDISNFLGVAHETINRILNTLKRKKIIHLKNKKLEILNINELKKLGRLDYTLIN